MICCLDRLLLCSSRTLQNLFLPWFTFIVWGICSASFLCFLCYIVTLYEWFVNIVLSTDVNWIGSIGINNTLATCTVAHRQLSPLLMLCSPATSTPNWPLSRWPQWPQDFFRREMKNPSVILYCDFSADTLHGTREVKTAETHDIMMSRLKEHQPFIFSVLSHGWLCFPASLYLLLLRALSVSKMSSFSLAKSPCGILNRHYICTKPGGLICASWVQFTVIHCHVWPRTRKHKL